MQRQEYLGDMVQDLTHGLRQLRARPLFTLAAVLTLAVGIGATTAEIGVRIALGARPADIVGLIVGQGMWLVVPGVLLGLAGALYLTRFLEHMLYHVHATDPVTFAQVAAVMVMVAVAGALVPAVRAAVTDPVLALRQE
jgi:ABC-type antimicrobial peptide transport system permease subunit